MFQKIIKSVLSSLLLFSTMSFAVQVELRNYNMTPAPLSVLEEHGEGAIVFDFLETENYEDVPHLVNGYVNTEIEITLTKIRVKDNNTSLITGEMLNYFDVSIESDGTLFFAQKVDIPKGTNASIYIPIEVTANSVQTDNERNGYIANLSCISDTTTPDISQYTYTVATPAIEIKDISMAPSPVKTVENGGEGNFTFNLFEGNGVDVPVTVVGDVNTEIAIDFKKCRLKDNNISNIFGTVNDYFDITTYNNGKGVLMRQKAVIPGDTLDSVRIVVEVTENAIAPTSSKVGGLVNISASTGAKGDGSDYVYTEEPTTPDYEVALTLDNTTFINDASAFFATIRITELLGGLNSGDVVYTINKNTLMTLNFDSALIENTDGRALDNANWVMEETDYLYKLKYIGQSGIFNASTRIYVGIAGVFTPPSATKGKFIFKVKLRSGSGDTVVENNEDSDAISYSNVN